MKTAVIVLLFVYLQSAYAEKKYIVPLENLNYAKWSVKPKLLAKNQKFAIVEMKSDEVEKLAHGMHWTKKTCGGFRDIHFDLQKKSVNFQSILQAEGLNPKLAKRIYNSNKTSNQILSYVKKDRYVQSLTQFTSFDNRSANSSLGVQAIQWLKDKAQEHAQALQRDDVEFQFVKTPGYIQDSLFIRIPGLNSELEPVGLGGHMDTFNYNKPGVDDDASGSIASLEVFRAILDSKNFFQRNLYFFFYAAEERGLVGSQAIAEIFSQRGQNFHGIMNLDMIAYLPQGQTQDFFFLSDNNSDSLTQYTIQLAKTHLGTTDEKIGFTSCGYACSDHASWYRKGNPTVTPFESSSSNMNRRLHTARDTINALNIDHAMGFVQLAALFMYDLGISQ